MCVIFETMDVHTNILFLGIISNNKESVTIAINGGANIHAQDDLALRLSILLGHLDIVKLLLRVGAYVDAHNGEPLALASLTNNPEMVEFLCSNSANPVGFNARAHKIAYALGHRRAREMIEKAITVNAASLIPSPPPPEPMTTDERNMDTSIKYILPLLEAIDSIKRAENSTNTSAS